MLRCSKNVQKLHPENNENNSSELWQSSFLLNYCKILAKWIHCIRFLSMGRTGIQEWSQKWQVIAMSIPVELTAGKQCLLQWHIICRTIRDIKCAHSHGCCVAGSESSIYILQPAWCLPFIEHPDTTTCIMQAVLRPRAKFDVQSAAGWHKQ